MERQFVIDNARERERLYNLVNQLTDEELQLPLYVEGWTVAVALVHLAFWDQRTAGLVKQWKKTGVVPLSLVDTDTINDALIPLSLAIPPRVAANLAVSAAEAVDRELEEASPELIADIERLKSPARLYRCIHRKSHLDEIEALIQKEGPVNK